jgi:hypothetical protein
MSDEELRRLYQGALARRSGGSGPSLEQLEALAAGRLGEQESLQLLDQVMAREDLRAEYDMLRAVHLAGQGEDLAVPARPGAIPSRAAPGASRRPWYLGLGLAASFLLAVGLWYGLGGKGDTPEQMRGAEAPVELHSPAAGSAARVPVVLAWAPVDGATSYRVELVNDAGAVVLTRETTDTATTLVPEDGLAPGAYRWWVEAQVPTGHVRSVLREVRLQAP